MKLAALNTGPDIHLLDHIGPLSEILSAPLLIEEERNFTLARRYYPQLNLQWINELSLQLEKLIEFDALFECKKWHPNLKRLIFDLYGKEIRFVFCPHGFSDKISPLLSYPTQESVLLYGDLHLNKLTELNIPPQIKAFCGNYRLDFYSRNKTFYDQLVDVQIFSQLNHKLPTVLYAPTWADQDGGSSFLNMGKKVIEQLPEDWNLIVKTHPFLESHHPAIFYQIERLIENKPNALLLNEFPPIYPILSRVDAYLGDTSSIGYDFLTFDKPLFFLPTVSLSSTPLTTCGQIIQNTHSIFQEIEKTEDTYSNQRRSVYAKTFKKLVNFKEEIKKAC